MRLSETQRHDLGQKMAAAYASGDSIRDLAAVFRRSYSLCRTLLLEQGVTLRGWGRKAQ